MIIKSFNYKFVNSTNDIAINLIKQKNIKAGFVLAEKQKKGRGQRGKKWISYKGNLFISIFFSLEKINLTLKQLTKTNTKLIIKLISQYYILPYRTKGFFLPAKFESLALPQTC